MKYCIAGLMVFLTIINGLAQNIAFEHINIEKGLSQVSVTSILQDEHGRIWLGTRDGLNVFDGTHTTTFRPQRDNENSLLGHNVRRLKKDGQYIWAATNRGISRLNTKTLSFEQFQFDGVLSIQPFEGRLLVGTRRGLFELNPETKGFTLKEKIFENNSSVYSMSVDNAGVLWVCSDDGLYRFDSQNGLSTRILEGRITKAFTDSKKRVWVGTTDKGVIVLNRQNEVSRMIQHTGDATSLVNNIIRDIIEDSKGNIWVGTFLGLSIINGESFQISNYQQADSNPKSLSHNSIYCLLKDYQGTIWIGTYFGGVSYYNPDYHIYQQYPVAKNSKSGVNYHVIGNILEDKAKNLWIATEGGGLDYFNKASQTFEHYLHQEGKNGLSSNNVKSLLLADKQHLLIGTHLGGLNVFNIQTKKFTSYLHDKNDSNSIPSDIITSIIPYEDYFLLGTHKGVIKFDFKKRTFSPFISDVETSNTIGDVIFCLFEDSFGLLWIGTERNGLFAYNPKTKDIKRYSDDGSDSSFTSNSVYCIFEDHQFRLWIGTMGGGLNQYIRNENRFINYSQAKKQLPSDFIYGIEESRFGYLWISTSKGLVRYDVDNQHFYTYEHNNGFPLHELNEGALYLSNSGEVFVGGINGLVSFNEEDLLKTVGHFNLLITGIEVNNNLVSPGDEIGLLDVDLPFTDEINLNPDQDVFTVNYSACNYVTTNHISYEYQLQGFNPNWVKAGNQTSVTYTNLDAGTYTFKVRVRSSNDNSIVDEKQLTIVVHPPFYKTWYAFVAYFVFVVLVILWINQFYLSRVRLEDSLKAEKREKEQMNELHQSKLRFFTNISHEFRTPLTLITGTLESILEDAKTSARVYKKLLTINGNANRLNSLVTELLDFRKLEQGFLNLKVAEYKVQSFLDEIFQSFVEYSQYHKIEYDYKIPSESLALWFDKKQLEKVFYNILSNAFKVVDDKGGKVVLEVLEQTTYIDIKITDNGPGMSKMDQEKIFDRFYQIDKVAGKTSGHGTGIGLALCKGIVQEHHGEVLVSGEEGIGTCFTVRLKKGNKHFEEKELVDEVPMSDIGIQPLPTEEYNSESNQPVSENAPTMLIVEDNHEARHMLKDIFASTYKLLEAENGEDGLNLAIDKQPDLILSDVMMPKLSGTQMCAKLKRNVQTSHIPIILLTARTALEYKIEGIETGADDYVTKPFNVKLLRARVKNLLQNRWLTQQKFKNNPSVDVKEVVNNAIDHKLLEKAREVVEQHIDDTDFDVNDFAKEVGLGRTRLYSKIKGVTGQTPNEFILSIRLKKAAEMLVGQPDLNVSEIAYAVGFSTPRYFSRCFREHFGVTPSKYLTGQSSNANADEKEELGE
ncbi:MAG: response regulator [Carboxylicivirga sp.]|jgi:signal transduction histidine kinase/ligand-binding sensor domain-containing protein/DNA-binding response OmpR family regulator|nr:response regulator [Carboxylicivirga sp.]